MIRVDVPGCQCNDRLDYRLQAAGFKAEDDGFPTWD
jgi:hypothetical protein